MDEIWVLEVVYEGIDRAYICAFLLNVPDLPNNRHLSALADMTR